MFFPSNKIEVNDKTDNNEETPESVFSDADAMDGELRLVARFHTLTLWRVLLSALLTAFEAMCAFYGLRAASGLYVLLSMNLLPWILEALCSPYVTKSKPVMPYLRRQYHYSTLRYVTTHITLFITCMYLLLWQFHNSTPAYPAAWLYDFPAILLAFSLLFRLAAPPLIARHLRRELGIL